MRRRPPERVTLAQFPILGRRMARPGSAIVCLTGRDRFFGRQDDVLPSDYFALKGGRSQPYRSGDQIVGMSAVPSRRATDFWEAGLLGQGNSRFRIRDWANVPPPLRRLEATGSLSMEHIDTRPFHDEVTFPWIRAIQQEVFTQFNAALRSQWSRM